MYYILYTFITATLGLVRDYSKHKIISYKKFVRTPILCLVIHNSIKYYYYINNYNYNNKNIIYSIVYERWFMLILKTCISYYNNDYVNKHSKYINKYKKNTTSNKKNTTSNKKNNTLNKKNTTLNNQSNNIQLKDFNTYHIV